MEHHIYTNNPLLEVVLQLRFPTILKIGTKVPDDFQEAIREDYPSFREGTTNQNTILFNVNPVNGMLPPSIQSQQFKNYSFISSDEKYKIDLTNSFISLSTQGYVSWNDFTQHLKKPIEEFIKIYKPAFFERIGLRYIDGLSKKKLKVEDKNWKDLVDGNWLGILSVQDEKNVQLSSSQAEYFLDNKEVLVRINAILGKDKERKENIFIIDSDVIKLKQSHINEYENVIEKLHGYSLGIFNSMITDVTRTAMK
ncbi:MAG: TIGR04255 family protein [Acidaminococcaceae bacterium]|nr:TIGR04255 family protein [Acidaminococcaceae bacterium]